MTPSLWKFLPELKKHHGIYVMMRTYEGTCAFLSGYEMGSGNFSLKAFHGWLVQRNKGRPELFWPQLVLCEVYEDGALPDIRYLTAEQDQKMVAILFDLLDEFIATGRQESLAD
ncbi:hypothetical protein ACIQM4_27610 [Streptomyces sp. NPDC091272]|uniref:hypothetical protein n=1 Tax=Streptomyces sp. NPDC091272 TaxID=3365981 RepID=UPI0038119A58